MKKTQRIDLLTTIRDTFVSFLAITMFVALGVGLFLGIHWISGSLHTMIGDATRDGHGHDIEITFPYGLTEEDVATVADLDKGDLEVEASHLSFQECKLADRKVTFRVGTLPENIDSFVRVDGELPAKNNQIALDATVAERLGFKLGDTVKFLPDGSNGSGMRYLKGDTYKVTALVISPAFLGTSPATYGMSTIGSGSIDALAWVREDAFNKDAFFGGMPYCLVRSAKLSELDPFSEEYRKAVADLEARVIEVGEPLRDKRLEMVHSLADLVTNEHVTKLIDIVGDFTENEAQYQAGTINKRQYEKRLSSLSGDLQDLLVSAGIANDTKVTTDHLRLVAAIVAPVIDSIGADNIAQLRASLSNIVDFTWIVLSRTYNGSIVVAEGFAGITSNLRWSMALLFLIVGLLVCYSAVSRIVHEMSTRIGTKKALGFRKKEISSLFMSYSALCVLLGILLGVGIAVFIVEGILLNTMASRFSMGLNAYTSTVDILAISALEMGLILAATWLAVHGVVKREARELLMGETPSKAKPRFFEKWAVWKRMGLLAQTTVNNCLSDRRRVAGTLVGVAGCTALIACAITLNDGVMNSFTRQYSTIMHYDTVSNVLDGSAAAKKGIDKLRDAGFEAAPVFQRNLTLRLPDGSMSIATITVPTDELSFDKIMSIIPVDSSKAKQKGVWVSQAYHEHLGAKVGDMVTLVDIAGNKSELPITGFFEWHLLSHQIVMSQELYEASFDAEATTNKFLIDSKGKGDKAVAKAIKSLKGYQSTRNDKSANERIFREFSKLSRIVVLVYLALATLMAAFVLLNLDFMYVSEKKRELIVLMICGYSVKEAKGYLWHDSVVLTAFGIILGILLGGSVGSLTVRSIEQNNASFLHGFSPMAIGVSTVGTIVLAGVALIIALRRVGRFDLTDINRV